MVFRRVKRNWSTTYVITGPRTDSSVLFDSEIVPSDNASIPNIDMNLSIIVSLHMSIRELVITVSCLK